MSVFPFISPSVLSTSSSAELPLFREYAYDFEHNRLLLRNGNTYLVEGNEALKIWVHKVLSTARFRYIAYDASYGSELDTLKGTPLNDAVAQSEVKRMMIEALMCNPYIKELDSFTFAASGSRLSVTFNCTTVYGAISVTKGGLTA